MTTILVHVFVVALHRFLHLPAQVMVLLLVKDWLPQLLEDDVVTEQETKFKLQSYIVHVYYYLSHSHIHVHISIMSGISHTK